MMSESFHSTMFKSSSDPLGSNRMPINCKSSEAEKESELIEEQEDNVSELLLVSDIIDWSTYARRKKCFFSPVFSVFTPLSKTHPRTSTNIHEHTSPKQEKCWKTLRKLLILTVTLRYVSILCLLLFINMLADRRSLGKTPKLNLLVSIFIRSHCRLCPKNYRINKSNILFIK